MNHLLPLLAFTLVLASCKAQEPEHDYEADKQAIENNLLPSLVIEGEAEQKFTLPDRMEHYNMPGFSVVYFEDGDIQWTAAYGLKSQESTEKVDPQTMFQAASISKPVAASAMMRMVQDGQLDLDADVNNYLIDWKVRENEFTETEKVTLRRLVTHNAGMTVHGFPGYAADAGFPTTVQVLNGEAPANTGAIFPDTTPGTEWRYSGGGYTVMQHVLEDLRQEPFPATMDELVLTPLHMDRSTYQQPISREQWNNIAMAHNGEGQKIEGDWHSYPEMAAAGLWTTPTDLAKWAIAIQKAYQGEDDSFISQETAQAILTKHMSDWGLGPGLRGEGDSLAFSHGGANNGFRCFLFAYAREGGPGFAIMTNGDQGSNIGDEYMRGLADHYGWDEFKPQVKKTISLPTDSLAQYVGRYSSDEDEVVRLYLEEGKLAFTLEWIDFQSVLLPEDQDVFFDRSDGQPVKFYRDASGKIAGIDAGQRFARIEE